jgi:uncharacterized protein with HEPN domain
MPTGDPRRRLSDIIDNIARIRRYVRGLTRKTFGADLKTQDAVAMCLLRISEAARKVGDDLDRKYPEAEFAKLRGLGNVLRHDYDEVDADLVWRSISTRLDALEAACRRETADD